MTDRYTKFVLTVIATALVYLCIVFTPLPGVAAQTARARPGEPTGPGETVIVGWRVPADEPVPVTVGSPIPVTVGGVVRVSGSVTTERSSGQADRVMIAGWEERGTLEHSGQLKAINPATNSAFPVTSLTTK